MKTIINILVFTFIMCQITTAQVIPFFGSTAGEGYGATTTGIGDFNGDGFDDFLVTTINTAGNDIGTARIFFGQGPYPGLQPAPDITITGVTGEGFGNSAAGDFDLNHDGFKDIIIGASKFNSYTGKVYIFYGRCDFPSAILSTSADMIFQGGAQGDRFGHSVSKAGDFNGDCHDDIIFSAPWASNSEGVVYVLFGSRNFLRLSVSELPTLKRKDKESGRSAAGDLFGHSLSFLGDINFDRVDDIIVGCPVLFEPGGRVYIFYGDCQSLFSSVEILGEPFDNDFGVSVAGLGDINKNGCRDFAVGDWRHPDLSQGKVYVCDGNQLKTFVSGSQVNPDIYEITGDNSTNGDGRFPNSLAGIGDYTGDGLDDFLVGGREFSYGNLSNAGRAYLFPGTLTNPTILTTPADILPFVKWTGLTNSAHIGYSCSWAGDINGDGRNDELWSGTGVDNGSFLSGAAFLDLSLSPFFYTKLQVKAFIAKRYDPGTNTQVPTKVKVCIYNDTCTLIDEKIVTLDEFGDARDADGSLGIKFNNIRSNGNQYYIVIEAMCNGVIRTWSKSTMGMQRGVTTYSYDFTTNDTKAYGDNQVEVEPGVFALHNGDVSADCSVDLEDILKIYNDVVIFASGDCCARTDIDGSGFVDLADLIYVYNNQFVICESPCSCPCP